jgi:predicted ArsR family transcriptional regulator
VPGKPPAAPAGRTRRAIARLLKTEGPMDSAQLARKLRLTPMAVRQHLYALQEQKLVSAEERPVPLGRPAKYWSLTPDADRLFPDAYAELSVALIGALGETFGASGMKRVLDTRSAKLLAAYTARTAPFKSTEGKLRELARVRTEEGYMAEVRPERNGGFLFIENHCPICAAATACQGFCTSELDLFRSVLGPDAQIERAEHIVSGDRRCVYRVKPRPSTRASRDVA